MRYYIEHEEARHFEQEGAVLLREMISADTVQKLLEAIQQVLQEKKEIIDIQKKENSALFSSGFFYARDIALLSQDIRKILFSKSIGHLACLLSNKKKVRYGGDWVWQGDSFPWRNGSRPFSSCFCVQPLVICCLVALSSGEEVQKENVWLPKLPGDALFFSPQKIFPCTEIPAVSALGNGQKSEQKFLLLAYADENALYTYVPSDPHTHYLKRLGHVFGDRLKETTHPHIVR